jgi:hypothetical protein
MSSEGSGNSELISETRQAPSEERVQRARRTKAQIAADEAERNRPARQSGRAIERRDTRGSVDMSKIEELFADGEDRPQRGDAGGEVGKIDSRKQPPASDKPGRSSDEETAQERPGLELDDDDDEPKPKSKRAKSITEFAEELELDPAKLYDLAVPFDDGESLTIGALKDRVREAGDLQRSRDDFEDYRMESQNDIFVARQQIDGVLQRITQLVPPETLARVFNDYQTQSAERLRENKAKIREWFPEWDDPERKNADKREFSELCRTYGFSQDEINNIADARYIKLGIDAMRVMKRYKRLKEGAQREKIPTTAPRSKTIRSPDRNTIADQQAKKGDQLGAIRTLIGD